MKTGRVFLIASCSTAIAFNLTLTSLPAADASARPLAPALQEVVKLAKSGVADSITLAYISADHHRDDATG
jgi:type IV secretory pathway VirB2 component (pilin)